MQAVKEGPMDKAMEKMSGELSSEKLHNIKEMLSFHRWKASGLGKIKCESTYEFEGKGEANG